MTVEVDWDKSICAEMDTDLFYQESSRGAIDPDDIRRTVCAFCPIVNECFEYAIENREQYGIWGGSLPQERLREIRLREGTRHWRWPQSSPGEFTVRNECPQGHDLTCSENVTMDTRGYRRCRVCRREKKAERRALARAMRMGA